LGNIWARDCGSALSCGKLVLWREAIDLKADIEGPDCGQNATQHVQAGEVFSDCLALLAIASNDAGEHEHNNAKGQEEGAVDDVI